MSAGSSFGKNFTVTTFGESHGAALGCVIDGCPAGIELSADDIRPYMDRRRPGQSEFTTKRNETDEVEILSGVFEGKTEGTPIALLIRNKDQHSKDYSEIASYYRPGHADYTFDQKFGFRDYRGGGRSSGRETAARVAAGAVAARLLNGLGIRAEAYTKSIGDIETGAFDPNEKNELYMPDHEAYLKAADYIRELSGKGDSAGGVIECVIHGVPAGLGDPVFDKLDASMAKALMSIGAVKAVEVGDGVLVSTYKGSEDNDGFTSENGKIVTTTNHSGGIMGGISNGSEIVLRCHVKPTPSISKEQATVKQDGSPIDVVIGGRHDPVVVPRAVVVVECMVAVTLLDAMISNMSSRAEYITDFYKSKK